MSLAQLLVKIWTDVLVERRSTVAVGADFVPVRSTRNKGLACVTFRYADLTLDGIEQNPETKSRWAKLARDGKKILQFSCRGRYVGNVCDGVLTRYPSWRSLGLPDDSRNVRPVPPLVCP